MPVRTLSAEERNGKCGSVEVREKWRRMIKK